MDLRSEQLKDTYGNLVTTGTTAGSPTTGGLQNGQGTLLTSVGIGTNSPNSYSNIKGLTIDGASGSLVDLEVNGTLKAEVFASTSNLNISAYDSHNTVFTTGAGTERMKIHSSGDISFRDTSTNEAFYWDASAGSLGIGTNTPVAELNVNGRIVIDDNAVSNPTGGASLVLDYQTTSDVQGRIRSRDWDAGVWKNLTAECNEFIVAAGGSEKVRIDSSGNVGIGGTAGDGYRLQLLGSSEAGNTLGMTYTGVGAGAIKVNSSGALEFGVDASDGSTERMRIDSSGNLLVGTTNTDPAFNRVNGLVILSTGNILTRATVSWDLGSNVTAPTHITFYTDNGSARVTAGNISSSGSTTSFNTSSDYRKKENVVEMTDSLDKISQLKPCEFNFIGEDTTMGGFLAHEVAEIVPNVVTGEKDAVDEEGNPIYQSIDHSKLVPLLVGAIQELRAEIEQLKTQL